MSSIENKETTSGEVPFGFTEPSTPFVSTVEKVFRMAMRVAPFVPLRALEMLLDRPLGNKNARLSAITTFSGGVLVGSALTALLTPVSGPELRWRLADLFAKVGDIIEDGKTVEQASPTDEPIGEHVGDVVSEPASSPFSTLSPREASPKPSPTEREAKRARPVPGPRAV